jgi:cysteine desulfurase
MNQLNRVYLDNASTTPVNPAVLDVMLPYLTEKYGNPSSLHREGRIVKGAIEKSRSKIAEIIGVDKNEIIFTSGGTESDNLAILGIARANQSNGKHIITSVIEHKAILDCCAQLEKEGFDVTYLGVDSDGQISLKQLESSLRPDTILVSIMYANNEIGSIQSIKQISEIIKQSKTSKPFFHSDACQASGVLSINVGEIGVDALTISSSKIYGPKGIGCLYLNNRVKIEPILFGGGQERGIRSGTENVAGIVGFAEALSIVQSDRLAENERQTKLRDYFFDEVSKIDDIRINGGLENRLPNNINFSIKGVEGESLVLLLDDRGVYCSTGSACSAADLNPSHVLIEIGVPLELAHCSVRFTLGRHSKKNDVDYVINVLADCITRIRSMSSIR